MNDITYPDNSKPSDKLRAHADIPWIEDCFVNYTSSVLVMINDYYVSVRGVGCGIIPCNEYSVEFVSWSVDIDVNNQTFFCNGGKMQSVIIKHKQSNRALKVDLSSFVETITITTFLKLTLDKNNKIVLHNSIPVFQGINNLYNFNTPDFLSKIYNFLQFGVTDIELNQKLATIH